MWRSGSSRRPHSAAAVTPLAPKPRTLSQCSRHDIPVRPAVRFPPFASRRSRHATRAKAPRSVPVYASRHPGSSRRSHSAAAVTPLAPKPRAPSQCSRHDIPVRPAARTPPPPSRRPRPVGLRRLARCAPGMPRTPSIWKRPAFLVTFGHSKRSRFVLRHRFWGTGGERQPGGLLGRRPKATRRWGAKRAVGAASARRDD